MLHLTAQAQPDNVFTGEWWRRLGEKDFGWQILSEPAGLFIAAIFTLGLYTLLYRENKFYRIVEHIFVGLAAGFSVVQIIVEVLFPLYYRPMVGRAPTEDLPMIPSYWVWAALLPIGFLAFFVFSTKNAWLSRVPIGIIIGLWAGQQFNAFMGRYLPQLSSMAQPVFPNTWTLAEPNQAIGTLTISQALSNIVLVITFLVVLSYFLYSFEQKSKLVQRSAMTGRWLLMVGFGVIFGTTMMTRFVLFIDRAYFILIDWLKLGPPN